MVTVSPEASVTDLAAALRDENVGSVVVTSSDGPVGIVTDRDLAIQVLAEGASGADLTARDLMSEDLVTVDADRGVFETIRAMSEGTVRRMPVVEDGALVGIVTLDDLFVLLADELATLEGVVEAESPPY